MAQHKYFHVEVFNHGTFRAWFPARSLKEVIATIFRLENAVNMSDLKLTYLIFQKNPDGRFTDSLYNYHKVGSLNATTSSWDVPQLQFLKEV